MAQVYSLKVCPFMVVVSTDWSALGQGVISQCSWSWGQPWHCFSGFAAFLGLEVKCNCELDVFDIGQNLIVLGA